MERSVTPTPRRRFAACLEIDRPLLKGRAPHLMIRILAPVFGSLIKFWFNAQVGPKCHPYPVDLNSRRIGRDICVHVSIHCPLHYADQLTFLPSYPFRPVCAITVGAEGARVASTHCSIPLLMMSPKSNFRVGSVASICLSMEPSCFTAEPPLFAAVVAHHFSRSGTKCARITTASARGRRTD